MLCNNVQLHRRPISLTETSQFIFNKFTQEFAEQDRNATRERKERKTVIK